LAKREISTGIGGARSLEHVASAGMIPASSGVRRSPVQTPTKCEVVIKTAKALASLPLLGRADEVIE